MKKRILSLVLCAAMLLSMCLFLGAGVAEDTTAEGSAESTESYIPAVNFTNVAPFVQANAQAANGPARAPLRAGANDGSATPTDPSRKTSDAVVTSKTATKNADGTYTIKLTSYTTGTVTQQTTTKPTDIVLVLDQSGSMSRCIVCGGTIGWGSYHTTYTEVNSISNSTTYYIKNGSGYTEVKYCNGKNHTTGACSGGPGWYTGVYRWDHTPENKITPKDSTHPNGTQFFERSEEDCSSRLSALKKAVTTFVDQVSKEATENNVDHRIAIVGFSSNDSDDDGTDFKNTEILTGCTVNNNNNGVQYVAKPTSEAYKDYISACGKALVTPQSAKAAIDYLEANGGTETDKGMQMAKDILDNDSKKNEDRNRVVVLFTDGVPLIYGSGSWNADSDNTITERANRAINTANSICGNATVYTVGVFSGANGDISKGLPQNNGSWENGTNKPNRFMHLVSSNYPDATAMDATGEKNSSLKNDDSYYLSAGDADTLNNIFKKISDNISTPSINLGKQAYVQDTVSDYFTAPVGGTVTVATQKAGYDASGKLVWTDETTPAGPKAEVNGKTVKVSGFDYDSNFVSQTGRNEANPKDGGDFYGRRLVVTFTVKAEPGFLGGNNVPTNDATSGVYDENEALVENFDYPRVNVPITTPALTSKGANVYYGGTVPTAGELCTTGAIGEKMADYVDITYSVDGSTVSNTQDGTYNVTMTVSPKYSGANANGDVQKAQTKNVMSTVNVYKPEVTFKDSIIDYNATPDYEQDNFVKVVWKHNGTDAVPENMTGTAPTLAYTYDPKQEPLTEDTYVNVTVSANGTALPKGVVAFVHDATCGFPGCSFDSTKGQFIVHIKVFDLTIKKTAKAGTTIDPNQTFVFRVHGNNNDVDMQVVITGPGEQTIKNLPMGSYTVTEDTSWSWKYTPVDKDGVAEPSQTITATGATTVTFENENKGTNWLTSLAKALNVWKDNGQTVERYPKN